MTIPDRTRLTGCAHHKKESFVTGDSFLWSSGRLSPLRIAELAAPFPLSRRSSDQVDDIAAKKEE